MATLTGKTPSEVYKDLLQVSNSNTGITTIDTAVSDGEGTDSPLKLSTTAVDINTAGSNSFKLGGTPITATATELNYVDGVTSAIQTQLASKGEKIITVNDSFVVGGSLANSTVSKTPAEARTLMGMGTGYSINQGTSANNMVLHGGSSSVAGFGHIDSNGKLISKTASESRGVIGLDTGSNVTFGKVTGTNNVKSKEMELTYIGTTAIALSLANVGKLFHWGTISGNTHTRHISVVIQDGASTYAKVDLASKSFTVSGAG